MKYGSRQSQEARAIAAGTESKGKLLAGDNRRLLSNPTQPTRRTQPNPKPEDAGRQSRARDVPDITDLFAQVDAEAWLAELLKAHGCDIYVGGPYETYADRLGACIVRNGMQMVVVGRREGRPETYRDCWERLYGRKLSDVPRETLDTKSSRYNVTT